MISLKKWRFFRRLVWDREDVKRYNMNPISVSVTQAEVNSMVESYLWTTVLMQPSHPPLERGLLILGA